MRNKGFTLIELLAVIVILAIIALIATPIILGIIKNVKVQANERSVENYLDAVEQAIMRKNINGIFNSTKCDIEGGKTICNGKELKVEIAGELPEEGTIYLNKGKVSPGTLLIYDSGYKTIMNEEGELMPLKIYNDGDVVYFDIKEGKSCTNYHEDNSKTGYNGLNETGNQTSCLKFYAFLDDGSKNLNLLLDHNTTAKLVWNSSGSNALGPAEIIQQLYEDTKGWNGTIIPSDYKYNYYTNDRVYIIEYSKAPSYEGATTPYKARLITAQEIAKITRADKEDTLNWKEENSTKGYYFFDLSTSVSTGRGDICKVDGCKYGWLYDRTSVVCTNYGCLNNSDMDIYGYWTSSAYADNSYSAWRIHVTGHVYEGFVDYVGDYGVRPVIEVSKSNL